MLKRQVSKRTSLNFNALWYTEVWERTAARDCAWEEIIGAEVRFYCDSVTGPLRPVTRQPSN